MDFGYKRTVSIPKKMPFNKVYQFKISLLGTDPPVWRRIQVPESYSFYDLHVAIQDSMGWEDYHLHMFEIKDGINLIRIHSPLMEPELNVKEQVYTTETFLKQFFNEEGRKARYYYDFGDGWQHEIILEKILLKEVEKKYPFCLDGELTCPPEDCGSIPGYYDCVEAFQNRKNKELLEWLGNWNPYNFSSRKVKFESPRKRLKKVMG